MKLAFVFTNYNNSDITIEAIESILEHTTISNVLIVVVDNKSTLIEKEKLSVKYENSLVVKIIFNESNLGYFSGLNCGIEFVRKCKFDFDFLVIGNNDLVFHKNFESQLENVNKKISKFPVISPDILSIDGFHQNPHLISRVSWFRDFIFDLYHSNYLLSRFIVYLSKITKKVTDRKDEENFEEEQFISQGYGACYILTTTFFLNFEKLWSPTFLLGEEFFLSKQLADKGFRVFYEPTIKVVHNCHVSTSKVPTKTMWKYSVIAHKIYRKHSKLFNLN